MDRQRTEGGPRASGVTLGRLPAGPLNAIVDVEGVLVGHATLAEGELQTGVTAILPHGGNLFKDKVPAACRVINGFGKSAGLVQVAELGTIESPILLSNTFSVPACVEGGLDLLLAENDDIARTTGSANVVAMECNDGYLSDMRRMAVTRAHVARAVAAARAGLGAASGSGSGSRTAFERGAVGAGRGMSCYGLKGGIGSSSRVAPLGTGLSSYTVGALLLTNFGRLEELVIGGRYVGREIMASGGAEGLAREAAGRAGDGSGVGRPGAGSVIVVLATDAPLDARQLGRLCMRAASGLARTGATIGHGSGEIALAFSTAYRVPHYPEDAPVARPALHEDHLDPLFEAATEAVEEAVIDSLFSAVTVTGRAGHRRLALRDLGLF